MSPQLTIITAAMSLGGMASVGWSHYGQVERDISNYHSNEAKEERQLEVAQVGEKVESSLAEMQKNFELERQKDREGYTAMLQNVATELELVKQQTSSHDILMKSLAYKQDNIEFSLAAMSDKFIPLRASGERFQPLKAETGQGHPLLPPVEESWTQNY